MSNSSILSRLLLSILLRCLLITLSGLDTRLAAVNSPKASLVGRAQNRQTEITGCMMSDSRTIRKEVYMAARDQPL